MIPFMFIFRSNSVLLSRNKYPFSTWRCQCNIQLLLHWVSLWSILLRCRRFSTYRARLVWNLPSMYKVQIACRCSQSRMFGSEVESGCVPGLDSVLVGSLGSCPILVWKQITFLLYVLCHLSSLLHSEKRRRSNCANLLIKIAHFHEYWTFDSSPNRILVSSLGFNPTWTRKSSILITLPCWLTY